MYHVRTHYHQAAPAKKLTMDPDCAICHAPATLACDCEAKGLETAIRQAEARVMQSVYNDVRYVLDSFSLCCCRPGRCWGRPVFRRRGTPPPPYQKIVRTRLTQMIGQCLGQSSRTGLYPRILSPTDRPAQASPHGSHRPDHPSCLPVLQCRTTPNRDRCSSDGAEARHRRGLAVISAALPRGPAVLLQPRSVSTRHSPRGR